MERYQVVGHLRLDPEGTVTSYADAQATVEALQRERDEYARMWRDGCIDRGEAYKVIVELTAALDAERAEIAKVRATCDMLGKERNEADEAKYHAELKLTQLQALVRGKEVTDGETE